MENWINIATSGHRHIREMDYLRLQAKRFVLWCKEKNRLGESIAVLIGGADGWDYEVAKNCYLHDVRYRLFFAYKSQYLKLRISLIGNAIFDGADDHYILKDEWEGNHIYMERNKMMVDRSEEVHVFYKDGLKGGTLNTLEYAKTQEKLFRNWY